MHLCSINVFHLYANILIDKQFILIFKKSYGFIRKTARLQSSIREIYVFIRNIYIYRYIYIDILKLYAASN